MKIFITENISQSLFIYRTNSTTFSLFFCFVYHPRNFWPKHKKSVEKAKRKFSIWRKFLFSSRKNFLHQTHTAETERLARKRKKRMRKSVKENFCFRIFLSLVKRGVFHEENFSHFLLSFSHIRMAGKEKSIKTIFWADPTLNDSLSMKDGQQLIVEQLKTLKISKSKACAKKNGDFSSPSPLLSLVIFWSFSRFSNVLFLVGWEAHFDVANVRLLKKKTGKG